MKQVAAHLLLPHKKESIVKFLNKQNMAMLSFVTSLGF